ARRRGLGLDRVARWTSAEPAALLGLAGKGRIAPGADADLVAFDTDAPHAVPADDPGPYAGRQLTGRIVGTWIAGRQVFPPPRDRKSTRLNSSHVKISYAVFCLKKR